MQCYITVGSMIRSIRLVLPSDRLTVIINYQHGYIRDY